MSILDNVEDTRKAGEIWGMSEHNVKRLAQKGKIKCKKIGTKWAIDMTQENPRKNKKLKRDE